MAHNVSQWLAEIRTLQRQLADAQQERNQALNSAANWRKLYETEARQRRREIQALRARLDAQGPAESPAPSAALPKDIEQLKERCQELAQLLEQERAAHAQTRQTLTTALGDTFDTLKPAPRALMAEPQETESTGESAS